MLFSKLDPNNTIDSIEPKRTEINGSISKHSKATAATLAMEDVEFLWPSETM